MSASLLNHYYYHFESYIQNYIYVQGIVKKHSLSIKSQSIFMLEKVTVIQEILDKFCKNILIISKKTPWAGIRKKKGI